MLMIETLQKIVISNRRYQEKQQDLQEADTKHHK